VQHIKSNDLEFIANEESNIFVAEGEGTVMNIGHSEFNNTRVADMALSEKHLQKRLAKHGLSINDVSKQKPKDAIIFLLSESRIIKGSNEATIFDNYIDIKNIEMPEVQKIELNTGAEAYVRYLYVQSNDMAGVGAVTAANYSEWNGATLPPP
jgi:hypothetical protein